MSIGWNIIIAGIWIFGTIFQAISLGDKMSRREPVGLHCLVLVLYVLNIVMQLVMAYNNGTRVR